MKLMVLDGNSIVNRAYYGVHALSTRDGTPTNAIFGFLNILSRLRQAEAPDALCITFDVKAPSFRKLRYPEYKAQRKGMPEELAVQMPILKDVLARMNIPTYELEGFEADDLLGTISKRCETAGWQCVVVTGDRDSFQLISPETTVRYVSSRMASADTCYTPEVFEAEYGFEPIHIIDLKALMGDSSDNIPGVPGIGEKTAMTLIQAFRTVDGVYANLESDLLKPAARRKLAEGEPLARLSYELATIRRDAPIEFDPADNVCREPDNDGLYTLLSALEFTKLIVQLGLTAPRSAAAAAPAESVIPDWTEVPADDAAGLDACLQAMSAAGKAVLILSDDASAAALAPMDGQSVIYTFDFSTAAIAREETLRRLLTADCTLAGHHIKAVQKQLLDLGLPTGTWDFDTALAAYLLDPTANDYTADALAAYYCGIVEAAAAENAQLDLFAAEAPTAGPVRVLKAVAALIPVLTARLDELRLMPLLTDLELPLCTVLAEMEHTGILVDREAMARFGASLGDAIAVLQENIYALAGHEFNVNSPKQLGTVLFEELMLPAPKKTKTGYSTGVEVLEKLIGKHPIIEQIMEYRKLSKLKSTYADGLPRFIAPDGRIHTTFQMTVTATGRLSSTDPNLQNIPVRTELGGELRRMFIAAPGCVLVDADYSQIELRLLAHIAGDTAMRDAFLSGADFHRVTAARVFGVPFEEVTPQQRSSAKAVNFGIVYGISQFSLSQDLHISVAEAKAYMDSYFEQYPDIRRYMDDVVVKAREDGFVSTLYGRRRALPDINSSNFNVRAFNERVALNMPVQGTAADIIKFSMIRVHRALREAGLQAKLLLQVHDELLVECPESEAAEVAELLCREMAAAAELSVPLLCEAGTGSSWYEAK